MSNKGINFELLEIFDEEEINIVCKNADLALFLIPIKDKRYTKYAKKLGRLDKKSALVQSFLPGIAFNLYKKGEEPFRAAVATQLESFRDKFFEAITNCMEPSVSIDEIKTYSAKDLAEFYFRIVEISVKDVSVEMFFVFLKLHDVCVQGEFRVEIEEEIEKILQTKKLEEKHKAEVANALKEQEKRLSAEFEQEKRDLKKQIEDKARIQRELKEKLDSAEQKIQKYENLSQAEKKKQKEEWFSEYEKEFAERKAADDLQWKTAFAEAEQMHEELVSRLEDETEQKKVELETEYQQKQRMEEERLSSELAGLRSQVEELTDNKVSLSQQVNALEERKAALGNQIDELESIEEKYFDSFEKRIVEKRIDTLIFQKLGFESNNNEVPTAIQTISENDSDIVTIHPKTFSVNASYGEAVDSIEDFFDDFRENISVNFENETEITGTVLAALSNGMAVISVDKVCTNLSEAIAALLDLSTPLIINIDSEKDSFKKIIDIINGCDSQVICVKGILDNYSENLFIRICEICREKHLFFSISNLEKLGMMSKAIMNCAIVVDIEHELHFATDEDILIGDHDLKPLIPKLDMKKSKEIYKKNFSRLVTGGYLKKTVALEYSNLLQFYMEFMDGAVLGDIIQKTIINACDFQSEDEVLKDILSRSGITIFN